MKMNKKVITIVVIGAMLLTGTTALAAGNGGRFFQEYSQQHTGALCDKDGDGLCDVTGNPVGTGNCAGNGSCTAAPAADPSQTAVDSTDTADTAAPAAAAGHHGGNGHGGGRHCQ